MKPAVCVVLLCVLVGATVAAVAIVQLNPLRSYFDGQGNIVLHGSVDPTLLRYLQRGPQPATQPAWVPIRDAHATVGFREDAFHLPPYMGPRPAAVRAGPPPDLVGALRAFLSWAVGLVMIDARAAPCNAVPAAPTNLAVTGVTDTTVSLSWSQTAPPNCTLDNDQVGKATVSGGPYTFVVIGSVVTSYVVTGLSPSTTYYFVVQSHDVKGWSPNSNQVSAMTDACGVGAGACFWIGGTGNFTDGTHWSATTGGASCACTPAATDTVTFDGLSGAGTATQNNATFTSGAVNMSVSSVTVAGSSNLWKIAGGWNDGGGVFSRGTSTLEFTANGTLGCTSGFIPRLYSVTVDNGVTTTQTGTCVFAAGGTFTINGTVSTTANIIMQVNGTPAQPLVVGAGYSIGAFGGDFKFCPTPNTTFSVNVPAFTYGGDLIFDLNANCGGGANTLVTYLIQAGTLKADHVYLASGFGMSAPNALNARQIVDMNGANFASVFNGAGIIVGNSNDVGVSAFLARTGTFAPADGGLNVTYTSEYVDLGSSTWTIPNTWSNASTSASWNAGTSTVTLTHGVSPYTIGLSPGLPVPEFHDLVLDDGLAAGNSMVFNTSSPLTFSGTLTLQQSLAGPAATTTLSLGANLVGGVVVIAARGILAAGTRAVTFSSLSQTGTGQLTMNSSTVTVTSISTDTGTVTITSWTAFDLITPNVVWTMTSTAGTSTLTVTLGTSLASAGIYNNGVWVVNGTPGAGNITFIAPSSWSSSTVSIGAAGSAGGGGNKGGAPTYLIACSFNPLFLSVTCRDATDYSLYHVTSVAWSFDGQLTVGSAAPNEAVSFRAPGLNWLSPPGDHEVSLQTYGGMQDVHSVALPTAQWPAWVFLAVVGLVVLVAAGRQLGRGRDRDVYFMPLSNPSYRSTAISVDEYPKGWRSYRQRDPNRYVRLRSRRRGNLWVVYGIRAATAAEQERTGRKYVAEVQTVRERL